METCTSLVEIRSTDICLLSRIEKIFAKKPCEIDRLFEWTLMTEILSLIVTAVGLLGVFLTGPLEILSLSRGRLEASTGSGTTIVPSPRGFLTFFIRI